MSRRLLPVDIMLLVAPRLGLLMLLPAGLLTIGVVYTQMHYAVDVLAGLLVAGVIGTMAAGRSSKP